MTLTFAEYDQDEEVLTTFILGHEFQLDELEDIANHGMSGGVGGFVYTSELNDIFEHNEDEIMDYLDEFYSGTEGCSAVEGISKRDDVEDMDAFRTMAVWSFVELNSYDFLVESKHPNWV